MSVCRSPRRRRNAFSINFSALSTDRATARRMWGPSVHRSLSNAFISSQNCVSRDARERCSPKDHERPASSPFACVGIEENQKLGSLRCLQDSHSGKTPGQPAGSRRGISQGMTHVKEEEKEAVRKAHQVIVCLFSPGASPLSTTARALSLNIVHSPSPGLEPISGCDTKR